MDEFLDDFANEAADIAREGMDAFRRALETYGLELTEELKQSFQYHVLRQVNQIVLEFDFREYGRFKDMAQLKYSAHQAPVEAMEFFIEKIGLDKFAFIQGEEYRGKQVPTVKNATRRLAWALAIGRRKVPSIKRGYRGTWYNENKMKVINEAKKRVRWRASEWIVKQLFSSINMTDK